MDFLEILEGIPMKMADGNIMALTILSDIKDEIGIADFTALALVLERFNIKGGIICELYSACGKDTKMVLKVVDCLSKGKITKKEFEDGIRKQNFNELI